MSTQHGARSFPSDLTLDSHEVCVPGDATTNETIPAFANVRSSLRFSEEEYEPLARRKWHCA